MAKRINYRLLAMGLITMLLSLTITVLAFHQAFSHQIAQDLSVETTLLCDEYNANPVPAALQIHNKQLARITLIAPDGSVLYESVAGGELGNHLNRPEVAAAFASGSGSARRNSETLGQSTYYYAMLLRDGTVLRLAKDANGLFVFFNRAMRLIPLICILILVFSLLLSRSVTKRLIRPIADMAEHLDD
ncbi:MAG: hypothetical protein PHS97_07125, partial [Oscillospiraceae bacterium]|nr:hypothetical protein [Oscillospiraceae bacterium]